jgi:hypothetical protein
MINNNITYSKIELLLRLPSAKVSDLQSTIKTEFLKCRMKLTANHIIIETYVEDDYGNVVSSKGQIYNLNDVIAYKTYEK